MKLSEKLRADGAHELAALEDAIERKCEEPFLLEMRALEMHDELLASAIAVVRWWLSEPRDGAPACIFQLRAAIERSLKP